MAKCDEYVIIPGTGQKVYEGSVVILYRLPNLRWILHYGYYNYNGKKQKGWYFSSIPSDTTMPVFNEDLVAMRVIDSPPGPVPPCPPCPPHPPVPPFPPGPGPEPPAPIPIPFTPHDKMQVDAAMLTLDNLVERDKLSNSLLQDGKIVRVNDIDGHGTLEYYSWNAQASAWEQASLGYRYMTRDEIEEAIADDIIDIVWSNENGALVLTNNGHTELNPVELTGVAHDPIFEHEELKITIPVYGRDPIEIVIPKDKYLRQLRFEMNTQIGTKVVPAIIATVSDGSTEEEIVCDISGVRGLFEGDESTTATINIDSENGHVVANVKLSSIMNNPLKVDNEGMYVDLSGVVAKQAIDEGFLLVADGNGEFTYGGDGVGIEQSTAISDLTDPTKKVVTANLIVDAISAAIEALKIVLEGEIADLATRIDSIEEKIDFNSGGGASGDGVVLVTSGDKLSRSFYTIGDDELDPESEEDKVATEKAVINAVSWHSF